jgi:ABC-type transport system involved in multi-copper enzyme maturation permease subunit
VTLSRILQTLNRTQRSRRFKVAASGLVILLSLAAIFTFVVSKAAQGIDAPGLVDPSVLDNQAGPGGPGAVVASDDAIKRPVAEQTPDERAANAERDAFRQQQKSTLDATNVAIRQLLSARSDTSGVLAGIAIISALALGVIWLGQGLSVLAALALVAGVAWPTWLIGRRFEVPTLEGAGKFISGVGTLSLGFVVLMALLRAALSAAHPVTTIARNVVSESVRIKVSLVFIVLLLFMLAAVPGLLDAENALRYRVQSFLSYGTGGAFWIIGMLTVFLAVGTVAFEQRDRVIWQTMTKPVSAWQYVLGKFIGVSGVAAVLLGVSASGVFLFTEYLSEQRALGELEPFVSADGRISEDRFILQSQVLTARLSQPPAIPSLAPDDFKKVLQKLVDDQRQSDANFRATPDEISKLADEFEKQRITQYLTLEPAQRRTFTFEGLRSVKAAGLPIVLRYKVSVGSDDPRNVQRVTFIFPNLPPRVQEVPLGQAMSIDVSPAAISSAGVLEVEVANGDFYAQLANPYTMNFPPDGLEVTYPAGSYRVNFLRAVAVLWLKLALLAMIGIFAATFLSFPVACLVAFGMFLLAESTSFLVVALDSFYAETAQGTVSYWKYPIRAIAVTISHIFRTYSELEPGKNLVDGRMLAWSTVASALAVLGLMISVLYTFASVIFSKRELATYSGQ